MIIPRITFIKSFGAVEIVEVPKEVPRSWRERLLSLPWRPWVKTKTVQVSGNRPAIVRIGNTFYYHPSLNLEEKIKEALHHADTT